MGTPLCVGHIRAGDPHRVGPTRVAFVYALCMAVGGAWGCTEQQRVDGTQWVVESSSGEAPPRVSQTG